MTFQKNHRNIAFFEHGNPDELRKRALNWANHFPQVISLHSNRFDNYPFGPFLDVTACGIGGSVKLENGKTLQSLQQDFDLAPDWRFGYFTYDLKNEIEQLTSNHPPRFGFPVASFFRPQHVLLWKENGVEIQTFDSPESIFSIISGFPFPKDFQPIRAEIVPDTSRPQYLETANRIRRHIEEGDVYELNYCVGFGSVPPIQIEPVGTFLKLCELSPMPFAAFVKEGPRFALCASPERFLKKQGNLLVSQPIKGTTKRGNTPEEDEMLKKYLRKSEKEQAENMMIVDLVRNDLARSCQTGSVKVPEMFGIYSFPRVHQMISTVTGTLGAHVTLAEAIRYAFPMGSMTGAPKIKAMELIDRSEQARRELFSGSIGYLSPSGDADLNVVIRTVFYQEQTGALGFSAGSAITYDAIPEQEYDEMWLKTAAIRALYHHA